MFIYGPALSVTSLGDTTSTTSPEMRICRSHKRIFLETMDDFDDFEVVFGSNSNIAYETSAADGIKSRRCTLENELFIDRLLKALGVQKGTSRLVFNFGLAHEFTRLVSNSYPAGSHQSLRNLHKQIISSSSPDHYKHSALYYLLKDLHKYSHQSPGDFASSSYLPGKYRTFIDGLWYLDRLEFEVLIQSSRW